MCKFDGKSMVGFVKMIHNNQTNSVECGYVYGCRVGMKVFVCVGVDSNNRRLDSWFAQVEHTSYCKYG